MNTACGVFAFIQLLVLSTFALDSLAGARTALTLIGFMFALVSAAAGDQLRLIESESA